MQLVDASRSKVKIKMNISAPTGFGKTIGALLIAYGITGDWQKIALIDSENKSGSFYSNHRLKNGFVIGKFKTIYIEPNYTPDKFISAMQLCVSNGIEVVIYDSMYHWWHGQGGILEYVQKLGGRYQDWAKGNPEWLKLINTILQSDVHVITTTRKKQAYEMSKDANGKSIVEKKGMEDQVRDGYEYEMTIAFEILNDQNLCKPSKDRSGMFMGRQEFIITPETGKEIKDWCESGEEPVKLVMNEIQFTKALERIAKGEVDLKSKLTETFQLTVNQSDLIETAIQKYNSIKQDAK